MALISRRARRWQFSVGVIAPAVLLLILTGATVLGFVIWSTQGADARALERQRALVARAIDRQITGLPATQESVALWDDAVQQVKGPPDKSWLDNNLGIWLFDYYGVDAAAVLTDRDAPYYTTIDGRSPAPEWLLSSWPAIEPLAADVRAQLASGMDPELQGQDYPSALDIKTIAGRPAVVSVMPIIPQTDAVAQAPGTEYLHVAVDFLDDRFARVLADNYQFEGVRFTADAATTPDRASYPMFDKTGRLVTFFEWRPYRPGVELLNQTGPVLGVGFLMAAILVIGLVNRLWASSSTLQSERIAATHQANHDPLTGLPNRLQFDTHLERDLNDRRRKWPIALLMLDLDRFKQVNDTLGHGAGDDLICAVGQRLREMVGPADILARFGGDEFAIIHPCREGPSQALKLANAIIDAIAKPFDVSGSEAFVGASIGLSLSGDGDRDPRELVRQADIALYEAKARGRNQVVVYEDSMNAQIQDQHIIEAELREALKRGTHLSVAFQPLFAGRSGEIVGAEALARWHHPRLGQISPARFIPIAEGSGLIEALGEVVLRRACTFGARWPGRRIAVNISPVQLRNPRFPERVFDLMVECAMRPSDLELEITESILLDEEGPALAAIETFRKAGIRVALDDFGTGYSSLNYLKRYPVDSIKIDRSFVAQLGPGSPSTAIVQAMITLAHALGIDVTAEGVETHEQMTILKAMGCNLFQGFLLAPPGTEDGVEGKFRRAAERKAATEQARVA